MEKNAVLRESLATTNILRALCVPKFFETGQKFSHGL